MTVGDVFDVLKKFKNVGISVAIGAVVWMYTHWYVPKLADDLKPILLEDIRDSLKDVVLNELRYEGVSFNLKLSEELGVPIHKVPSVISKSVMVTDSAKTYTYLVEVLDGLRAVTDVGVKVDRKTGRFFFLKPDGTIGDAYSDIIGIYRFSKNGDKWYLYKY